MSPVTVVKPKVLKEFMRRNGYSGTEHVVAQWLRFLQIKTSLRGYMYDLERIWLRSLGARGNTQHELWVSFLQQEGYITTKTGMKLFFENWSEAPAVTGGMAVPALAGLWTLE